jgi:hypothetical protein
MNTTTQSEPFANKIADAIVDLVNDSDGPVTFSRIALEVPGFAAQKPPTHGYALELRPGTEMLLWSGMSEAGYLALRKIINGRRVAIQFVSALPYILDCFPVDDDWMPAMLLPTKGANFETPRWLIRASDDHRSHVMRRVTADNKGGYRMLTPGPLRFTADQFLI